MQSKNTEEDMESIKNHLTKRETAAVFRLRVMVVLVLVLAAVAVTLTVYKLTRDAQIAAFEDHFEGSAEVRNAPI